MTVSQLNVFTEARYVLVAAIGAGHNTQIAEQALESVIPRAGWD